MSTATITRKSVKVLVYMSLLTAIIILMSFTPIGYLQITPMLKITFLSIPVAVGAIVLGPVYGAVLGAVFGATSFWQCFGMDYFGTTLLGLNPVGTFITCFAARILAGFLTGVIFRAVKKVDKTPIVSYAVASASTAVLNTVFFMGLLWAFFGNSEFIMGFTGGSSNFFVIIGVLAGAQAIVEAVVCLVAGAAVSKAIDKYVKI